MMEYSCGELYTDYLALCARLPCFMCYLSNDEGWAYTYELPCFLCYLRKDEGWSYIYELSNNRDIPQCSKKLNSQYPNKDESKDSFTLYHKTW